MIARRDLKGNTVNFQMYYYIYKSFLSVLMDVATEGFAFQVGVFAQTVTKA